MKFKINNTEWEIKEISNADMQDKFCLDDKFTHGITRYSENTIYINTDSKSILRTLKHELMHVWLCEYGHNQDEKAFNNEDVCEIVASSNDFINEIAEQYKNSRVAVKVSFNTRKLEKELNKCKRKLKQIVEESIEVSI